jgi:hypothetical protein
MLTALVAAPCLLARPSIIINGDPPDPTIIFSSSFSLTADESGGGNLSFVNGSGTRFTELDIFVSLPMLEAITCGPGPFITCTPTPLGAPTDKPLPFDIIFGPAPGGGIAPGEGFSINLNNDGTTNKDPNGPGDWGSNTTFEVIANTPEPAVWAMTAVGILATGFITFLLRRSSARRSAARG